MSVTSVREILRGALPPGATVKVHGWVRTRRDSKAGLSFIHLSDGSSFDPIQIVAPNALPNYASDVLKLTSGCAIEAEGELVASQGQGQKVEVAASAVKVVGWVDDPEKYPIQPKLNVASRKPTSSAWSVPSLKL